MNPRSVETESLAILLGIFKNPPGETMGSIFDAHPRVYAMLRDMVLKDTLQLFPDLHKTDERRFRTISKFRTEWITLGWTEFFLSFETPPPRPKQTRNQKNGKTD